MKALFLAAAVAVAVGCSGGQDMAPQFVAMRGRCAADLTLYIASQPMLLTVNGEGSDTGHLVGDVVLSFGGWRLLCSGSGGAAHCAAEPILAGPGVPAPSDFRVDPDY